MYIEKDFLVEEYLQKKLSMKEIADNLRCSQNNVAYWMNKHEIKRRNISEAVYQKRNPTGDPFVFRNPSNLDEAILFGIGIGLFWGEGTKANKTSIRLGNTDPDLIKTFLVFLNTFFGISQEQLKFGLQVFSDMNGDETRIFWQKQLGVKKKQFYKVTITPYRSIGNYRHKTKYGVLTIYFHNVKARNILMNLIENERYARLLLPKTPL
jgi:hypothetical protein